MGAVSFLRDRLTNVMSGMGTTVDRRTAGFYAFMPVTPEQAEAAYRSSWLVRKIVDIPPLDMTREWRDWQADGADIQKIEAEEKRLGLKVKCKRALILARLYGGGALILGNRDSDPMQPLAPERIATAGLTYVHVMSRHQLTLGQAIMDPASPWFGKPEWFEIRASNSQSVRLHPSRVVEFIGQHAPEGSVYAADWFWGDPIMQSIGDAVKNADIAQAGFAALIDEAKLDIIKIPDLMASVGTQEYEDRLLQRLAAANAGKSTWRALMIDGAEEWQQRQITWTGIPDIISSYLNIVSGAADIPVTRLLGQSPKGLQSTGDGEERDYHAMVKARQDEMLCPALDRIDELLIRSALGSRPADVYYEWAPLAHLPEKDAATIEKQAAETVKILAETALIPNDALAKAAANRMIESGRWPGLETAIAESEQELGEEPEGDPNDLLTSEERAQELVRRGAISEDRALQIADAQPRSLYVSRKLINAAELIGWAKGQGFETTLPAGDLHVTVIYSRTPVDWMKMGSTWSGDEKGWTRVRPGGARLIERFGEAVVLLFNESELSWRHEEMVRNGASHDFDDYQPHVTITYQLPEGMDLAQVEPFRGELIFGPEIFEEIDEDYKSKLAEA